MKHKLYYNVRGQNVDIDLKEDITFNDFRALTLLDQVKFINDCLMAGETLTGIGSKRHINKSYIRQHFEDNNYFYNKDSKTYKLDKWAIEEEQASIIIPSNDFENRLIKSEQKLNKTIYDFEKRFNDVELNIKAMALWLEKGQPSPLDNNKNELNINISEFSGEVKTRSFKIYGNVLDQFILFCNEHKNNRQQDIMTQALLEFINKYKLGDKD
jgi:hypothetical protein